jgi:hypothetical protein
MRNTLQASVAMRPNQKQEFRNAGMGEKSGDSASIRVWRDCRFANLAGHEPKAYLINGRKNVGERLCLSRCSPIFTERRSARVFSL